MKERWQNSLEQIYQKFALKGYRLKIENEENLKGLTDPQTPFVVYFNHLAGDDPVVVSALVNQVTKGSREILMPVSQEYVFLKGGLIWYAIGVLGARHLLGWQMPEIIQSYRLRDERLSESKNSEMRNKSFKLSRLFFEKVKERLQQEEKPIIVISPEGHRSEQGLLPAEDGIGVLARLMRENNGLILPLGLIYHGGKRGLNYNPLNPLSVDVVVGCPLIYDEVEAKAEELYSSYSLPFSEKSKAMIAHTLMWHLTQLLPEDLHGYYSSSLIKETLEGHRQLGINQKGEVVVIDK